MNNSINTKEIKKLLISHTYFSLARHIFVIFINLYIWKLTTDIRDVALFNIIFFLTHSLSFGYFAKFVKKNKANLIKTIGLIGLVFFYLLIFYLEERAVDHLVTLAIIWGIFNPMYWLSYHVQNFDATHTKNRGHYAGAEKIVKTSSALIAPLVGGIIISFNIFNTGYGAVFFLAAILTILTILTGNIDLKKPNNTSPYHPIKTLKNLWRNQSQRKILFCSTLSNIGYIRATEKILTIFLLIVLGAELHVGIVLTFFACFSIISTYVIGRYINYNQLKKIALLFSVFLSGSFAGLILAPGLISYMIFGSIKQISEPLIGLGRRVFGLNLLHEDKNQNDHRVEYMVIREWFGVGIGASVSFLPLLFIKEFTIINLIPVLIFMALATLLEGIIINSIKTDITKL